MVELEIQILATKREGLLIDVGRIAMAGGFTLLRHRLTQNTHGALMTLVVRGPKGRRRALESALDAHERIVSFQSDLHEAGAERPHFAAIRRFAYTPPEVPASMPEPEPPAAAASVMTPAAAVQDADDAVGQVDVEAGSRQAEPEREFDFIEPRAAAPATPTAETEPYLEPAPDGPDHAALEQIWPKLVSGYPYITPRLQKLDRSVAPGARVATLQLAGMRIGAWVAERELEAGVKYRLRDALEQVAVPALAELVTVHREGDQLHMPDSPLCTELGHSGCMFFSGYLEGLLRPLADVEGQGLGVLPVCCRAYGAADCILAISA